MPSWCWRIAWGGENPHKFGKRKHQKHEQEWSFPKTVLNQTLPHLQDNLNYVTRPRKRTHIIQPWPAFPTSSQITLHLTHHTPRPEASFILLEHTESHPSSVFICAVPLAQKPEAPFLSSHPWGPNLNATGACPITLTRVACSHYPPTIPSCSFPLYIKWSPIFVWWFIYLLSVAPTRMQVSYGRDFACLVHAIFPAPSTCLACHSHQPIDFSSF